MNSLDYYKNEIIKILKKQAEVASKSFAKSVELIDCLYLQKANMQVGHVSTYKDGSMWKKIQSNPPKWKCIRQGKNFSSETSGAKQSITKLINKVRDCKNTDELLDIVMFNFNRFCDEKGQLLPIVENLAKEVNRQKAIIKGQELKGISFGDKVQDWIVDLAESAGVDIKGYRYRLTKDFEAHAVKEHGNPHAESSRGQVAVTKKDIEIIGSVIDNPDIAVAGLKKNGQDTVILCKNDGRGGSVLVEEVLASKKNRALNAKTYWIMKNPVKEGQIGNILKNNGNYDVSNIKIAAAVAVNSTGFRSMNSANATNSFHADGNLSERVEHTLIGRSGENPAPASGSVSGRSDNSNIAQDNSLVNQKMTYAVDDFKKYANDYGFTEQEVKDLKYLFNNYMNHSTKKLNRKAFREQLDLSTRAGNKILYKITKKLCKDNGLALYDRVKLPPNAVHNAIEDMFMNYIGDGNGGDEPPKDREKKPKQKNQKVELTEKQKKNLAKINDILNKNVESFPVGNFSEENFKKLFENGIDSPIEHIKIGENQYQKLIDKNRQDLIAAMADVMKNPALIMKTDTGAKIYAKTYERENHKKTVISVIVDKGKLHISISTHIEKNKQLAKKMDSILFDRTESVHGETPHESNTPDNSNIAQDNSLVNQKIYATRNGVTTEEERKKQLKAASEEDNKLINGLNTSDERKGILRIYVSVASGDMETKRDKLHALCKGNVLNDIMDSIGKGYEPVEYKRRNNHSDYFFRIKNENGTFSDGGAIDKNIFEFAKFMWLNRNNKTVKNAINKKRAVKKSIRIVVKKSFYDEFFNERRNFVWSR